MYLVLKHYNNVLWYCILAVRLSNFHACSVWANNTDKDLFQGVQNIIWRLHFHINSCVGVQSVESATKLWYNYMLLDWNFKDMFLMLEKWLISWNGSWASTPWQLNLLAHAQCTLIKNKIKFSSNMYKEIQNGAVAKLNMRKDFLIYEEMHKYLTIYKEGVSHMWLWNCSNLNFLLYEENFIFFFIYEQYYKFHRAWTIVSPMVKRYLYSYSIVQEHWLKAGFPATFFLTRIRPQNCEVSKVTFLASSM